MKSYLVIDDILISDYNDLINALKLKKYPHELILYRADIGCYTKIHKKCIIELIESYGYANKVYILFNSINTDNIPNEILTHKDFSFKTDCDVSYHWKSISKEEFNFEILIKFYEDLKCTTFLQL